MRTPHEEIEWIIKKHSEPKFDWTQAILESVIMALFLGLGLMAIIAYELPL